MTPIGQDKKTLTFKVLLYLFRQDHGFDPPVWISSGTGVSKIEIILFTSVVASATRTYLRMKDIMRLCANFFWCVLSRWIENVRTRRNVVFDSYLSDLKFDFCVSFFPQVATCSKLVPSVFALKS